MKLQKIKIANHGKQVRNTLNWGDKKDRKNTTSSYTTTIKIMCDLSEENPDEMRSSSGAHAVDPVETGADAGARRTVRSDIRCSVYSSKRFFEMKRHGRWVGSRVSFIADKRAERLFPLDVGRALQTVERVKRDRSAASGWRSLKLRALQ